MKKKKEKRSRRKRKIKYDVTSDEDEVEEEFEEEERTGAEQVINEEDYEGETEVEDNDANANDDDIGNSRDLLDEPVVSTEPAPVQNIQAKIQETEPIIKKEAKEEEEGGEKMEMGEGREGIEPAIPPVSEAAAEDGGTRRTGDAPETEGEVMSLPVTFPAAVPHYVSRILLIVYCLVLWCGQSENDRKTKLVNSCKVEG